MITAFIVAKLFVGAKGIDMYSATTADFWIVIRCHMTGAGFFNIRIWYRGDVLGHQLATVLAFCSNVIRSKDFAMQFCGYVVGKFNFGIG